MKLKYLDCDAIKKKNVALAKNKNIWHNRNYYVSPSLVRQFSIDTPSKLWSMYGVSMEYVWSIFEGRTDLKHRKSPSLSTKDKVSKG